MLVEQDEYYIVGEPLTELTVPLAIKASLACVDDPRFTVLGCYCSETDSAVEMVIVECKNNAVPSKNKVGIRFVERLALVFSKDKKVAPEVWALRKDFPATAHQNATASNMPASLCLYFEPWATVARAWTGHKHLDRIAGWLSDTASGVLHRSEQPVEQFYYTSPIELVLPPGVKANGLPPAQVLFVHATQREVSQKTLLVAELGERVDSNTGPQLSTAFITVEPIISGSIERPANTLGELQDQLIRRGSDLLKPLIEEINRVAVEGIPVANNERGLVIVRVPIQRTAYGEIEAHQVMGFVLPVGIGPVGQAMNILAPPINGKYIRATVIGGDPGTAWRDLKIDGIAVIDALDLRRAQQLTGVLPKTADFRGVLIGAGSLGSQLGDIWAREAWGTWTLIDDDLVKPHNVPRHRAYYGHLGVSKAPAVVSQMNGCFPTGQAQHSSLVADATSTEANVVAALTHADLIVDVSTTLYVPRDLSRRNDLRRLSSIFMTPSGTSSVILLEDAERRLRIDSLEAQYYRAIIHSPWGAKHLSGHLADKLWVGAGCREATTVLSPEMIAIHTGALCRQLRRRRDQPDAHIGIWQYDDDTGSLISQPVSAYPIIEEQRADWRIVWDHGLRDSIQSMRAQRLPNETGGILVGYIDHVLKSVYLVDALAATPDSIESDGSFARGVEGLAQRVSEISALTAGIVGYVGEWHSHPNGFSANPSLDDISQLAFLTLHLRQEGAPALMLIAGDKQESVILGVSKIAARKRSVQNE